MFLGCADHMRKFLALHIAFVNLVTLNTSGMWMKMEKTAAHTYVSECVDICCESPETRCVSDPDPARTTC